MTLILAKGHFYPSSHYSQQLLLLTPPTRLSFSPRPHQSGCFSPSNLRRSFTVRRLRCVDACQEEDQICFQLSGEEVPFIAQYLVSLGFSLDRALKVCSYRNLTAVKTQDRPDSVLSFLREIGLSDSQIRSVVSFKPVLLSVSVEKVLKPQVRALNDAGFDREMLIQLIRSNPQCLYLKNTLSNIQFWRNFVGNSDDALLKLIQNNGLLISRNIDKHVIPKLDFLKEYGLSDGQIVKVVTTLAGFLLWRLDSIRWALKKTEKLGIPRESKMFIYIAGSLKKGALEKKMEIFTDMYGWSEEEFYSAIRKSPVTLGLSEESIMSKMDFLIEKVGIEPRYIASRPRLLTCSKEKVFIPRHNVLSTLEAKGLIEKCSFLSACVMSEKRFLERFVVLYEKDVPEVRELYVAARGEKGTV